MPRILFHIACTTCDARLSVRDLSAIGAILNCPKCASMVEVIPPPGWEPPEDALPPAAETAAAATITTHQPGGESVAAAPVEEIPPPDADPRPPVAGDRANCPCESLPVAGDRANRSCEPPESAPPVDLSDPETVAGTASRRASPPANQGWASPTETALRRWLVLGAVPVAVVMIAIGAWLLIPSRTAAPPRPEPSAPADQARQGETPVPTEPVAAADAQPVDPRWLPARAKLVFSARLSRLSAGGELDSARAVAEPAWQASAGRVLAAFGLPASVVRRLTWSSTDLADWTAASVVLIELEEGQDAGVFLTAGEPVGFRLAGVECRRRADSDWDRPFVVIDSRTILTGREDLLRQLADRTASAALPASLAPFLVSAAADADLLLALDLDSARACDWKLPTAWMDVWPRAGPSWRTLWELPTGLGIALRRDRWTLSETAWVCDAKTVAEKVRSALDDLAAIANQGLQGRVEQLSAGVRSGALAAADADRYETALAWAATALESAKYEIVEETVWLRTDWGEDVNDAARAALDSRGAIRCDWLAAAASGDEARHQQLLSALQSHHKAEGGFPAGVGGGGILAPETRLSWIATMLPYLGYREWHRQLEPGYSWNSPQNRSVTRRELPEVINPALGPGRSEAGFPVTHYVGCAGVGVGAGELPADDPRAGVFSFGRKRGLEEIADGTSNTIATVGVADHLGAWAAGGQPTVRSFTQRPYVNGPDGFGSGQPNGMFVGMADGSVRFLSEDIDPTVLEQLATAAGGERTDMAALGRRLPRAAGPVPVVTVPVVTVPVKHVPADVPDIAGRTDDAQPLATVPDPVGANIEALLSDSIGGLDLPGVSLGAAIRLLTDVSTVQVTFDLDAMTRLDVRLTDPIRLELESSTLGDALERILAERGLAYVVQDDQLLVTSLAKKQNTLRKLRYTISDLGANTPGGDAELAELLVRLVAPGTWHSAGGQGTIEAGGGVLQVFQTESVHARIIRFCEKLRIARGLPLRSRENPDRFRLDSRVGRASAVLEQPVTLNYLDEVSLGRAVDDLSELGQVTIAVHRIALTAEGKSADMPAMLRVNGAPLGEALARLLKPLGLSFRVVDEHTIEITTRQAVENRLEVEFYPLGTILATGRDGAEVLERIKAEVAGQTWADAGGPGEMHFDAPSKCLLVLQSQPVQVQVEKLLARLAIERPDVAGE